MKNLPQKIASNRYVYMYYMSRDVTKKQDLGSNCPADHGVFFFRYTDSKIHILVQSEISSF